MIPRLKACFEKEEFFALFKSKKDAKSRFEKAFTKKFHAKHGIFFKYGRSALFAFFSSHNIKTTEVVVPAYTCVVVAEAIVLSGNKPIFVDSSINDYNMDIDAMEKKITKNTSAVILTNIFGYPLDYKRAISIIKKKEKEFKKKIFIIQDCAHSFDARINGETVCDKGDFTIYGLNISKIISTVVGGMLTTNNKAIYNKIKSFSDKRSIPCSFLSRIKSFLYFIALFFAFTKKGYSLVNWCERNNIIDSLTKYYDPNKISLPKDFLSSVPLFFFTVGLAQIKKYDFIVNHRKKISKYYAKEISKIRDVVQLMPFNREATYSHFTVLVDDKKKVLEYALSKNIQLGWLIEYSVPLLPAYKKMKSSSFPHSKFFSNHAINLPVHCDVSLNDAKKVISVLKESLL